MRLLTDLSPRPVVNMFVGVADLSESEPRIHELLRNLHRRFRHLIDADRHINDATQGNDGDLHVADNFEHGPTCKWARGCVVELAERAAHSGETTPGGVEPSGGCEEIASEFLGVR